MIDLHKSLELRAAGDFDVPKSMVITKMVMVPVIDNHATGEAIRKKRLSSLLSLREVAKECGWSAAHQCDLERGFRAWSERKCRLVENAIEKLFSAKYPPTTTP
jgi:hypothetical protein